jgi:hypothetical protein
VKAYLQGRWQGWDYWDGGNAFHSDYCTYTLKGANLTDLFPREPELDIEAIAQRLA